MADIPLVDNPIGAAKSGIFGFGEDAAKLVIRPGRFVRPRISSPGGPSFEWPLGTEGMRYFGNAELGIHKYFGDKEVVVDVIHRDESRIEMTGNFPGSTGVQNMRALKEVITEPPGTGLILYLPRILEFSQRVKMENYEFNLTPDNDRTGTITYTVTFIRLGSKNKIKLGHIVDPPRDEFSIPKRKGFKDEFGVTVTTERRTLRALARYAFDDPSQWWRLYNINLDQLHDILPAGSTSVKYATAILPVGMMLRTR